MTVTCGIDWASDHHDVALIDHEGTLLSRARINDDLEGLHQLLSLLTAHGDSANTLIPVAIKTSRGLLVACLRATGRPVYAINPMAAARYRDRHTVTRKKSDHLDAMVLANILRTDKAAHRPLPDDSELARAIAVLARAQQDAVWDRTQAGNKLRSHLRECFPGFLATFQHNREGISSNVARVLLAAAPTPEQAARLTRVQLRSLLKRAGRQRGIEAEAERLRDALRIPQMRQPPQVEQAMGRQAIALLRQLDAACTSVDDLAEATVESFDTHPDAEVITSFPGLGALTGARVLAEIGDDRSRFTDARGLKAFAGAAPVTRASGRSLAVMARRVKNQRLASVGYVWAFASLTASPGARAHYDRRRADGDRHTAAQRNLFNRMLGCLHHCLTKRTRYDELAAFPAPSTPQLTIAA
ncbi:IS110 family transposase (plasmid) [Streptomyces sp. NBC_01591]|uniref:IS110 family transposase n=1 Tax=Streptomyces sp. NBC_01591 TaxID=2975888 RepID=UPI002DD8F32B|nr:IS110 family transposase [Streptomyces sp. NBC_01591]WSD73121.1 IS110 family transposase [Streptomyces sp. NBC_01591]WSD73584.1 IS110 family transposase [Streptomyces sp. NBC_01591]WSD74607.1 IS110 family transposase [Streptomyces sp. NBC_01591]WSD74673.1 IS110 family transposase [Streptomyces sp. NBC_01591]